jgi:hypothetical protein
LLTKFNKKHKTFFLDTSSPHNNIDEPVNIILSPSLYWVKRLLLPVQKASEVKKLLRSIFEDILPPGNYNYSAYRDGEYFFTFAYDDKLIIDTLEEKGISISNVVGVYFAQKELGFIDGARKINKTQSVFFKDEILISLPSQLFKEGEYVDVDKIPLSKHSIKLSEFGNIIDTNTLYRVGAILISLIFVIITELLITSSKADQYNTKKESLFKNAKLQATMFQNKAMLKKYTKIHTKQVKIREIMNIILSTKLNSSETLNKLIFKDKKLTAYYSTISQKTIVSIKKVLNTKKVKFYIKKKKEQHIVEITL